MVTAPARRVLVRDMTAQGVSQRRALALVRMSASSLRYTPAPDTNAALRTRIVALAHRHRRYGAGMIYLKLRQAGEPVNHKRVERLYTEAKLQVRRRRRKKIPLADRQPLVRPQAPNEVWSADFVFDRTADGRVVKLHEYPTSPPLGGLSVSSTRRRLESERNSAGDAVHGRIARRHVALDRAGQAEPERVFESFNGRFRDECLKALHESGPYAGPHRNLAASRGARSRDWAGSRRPVAKRLSRNAAAPSGYSIEGVTKSIRVHDTVGALPAERPSLLR